jgi:hypothetical protein
MEIVFLRWNDDDDGDDNDIIIIIIHIPYFTAVQLALRRVQVH